MSSQVTTPIPVVTTSANVDVSKIVIPSKTIPPMPPVAPSKVSSPSPHLPPTPSKTVLFEMVGGQWKVSVTLGENDPPFTPRDFNLLARSLTVKVQEIRRLAYLRYLENQKAKAKRESLSDLIKSPQV